MADKITPSNFWEKDDLSRMDGLMRIDRYIKNKGTDSAGIWFAWHEIKKELKKYRYKYKGTE